MKINQDIVPATIESAARHIADSMSDEDRKLVIEDADIGAKVHHTIRQYLRNNWSLWESDSPLKRDAGEKYKIAHADDISGLIIDWASALVRAVEFDPLEYCDRFHAHWAIYGTDSLSAGGWPPKDGGGEIGIQRNQP